MVLVGAPSVLLPARLLSPKLVSVLRLSFCQPIVLPKLRTCGASVISFMLEILLDLLGRGTHGAHRFSERLDGYPEFFCPVLALVFLFQADTTWVCWARFFAVWHRVCLRL